ncbi:MAG: cation:dicarboxylase symporter family transporter [Alphaproteobacteria bacterium]|nr:cation:dicarboxylase symporter family transporter [Alphaproteobacteria bacterium]
MTQPVKEMLKATTALTHRDAVNARVLEGLGLGDEPREKIIEKVVRQHPGDNADERWQNVKKSRKTLTVEELAEILREMEQNGYAANAEKAADKKRKSPLNEQAFYDALAKNIEDAEKLKAQLEKLREESKKEKGYLSTAFNLFADKKPVEKALSSVSEFEKYCHKNGITYDEVGRQLVAGEKPRTAFDRIKDFRFLIAAGAGGLLGLGGISLAGAVPALGMVTGAFFGGLPYLALPFITLSIFKAFSEKSLLKEAGTLGRFGAVMAAGFTISLGITAAMSGILPVIDPATVGMAAKGVATTVAGHVPFSPSQLILQGIAAGAAFGSVYRYAKQRIANGFAKTADAGKNVLAKAFNKAADVLVNKHTAPVINAIGKAADKAASGMDKLFGHYMNFIGIPAVAILMSGALAGGGVAALAAYGGYYATVFTGMAVTSVALGALGYFRYGLRKKEFGSLAKIAGTALGTSSSAATMPVTKQNLKEIGVPDHITNSVVPLGANFNMLGTSLYLGATAAAALVMFGFAPTLPVLAMVGLTTVLTAFGAPGMPSSNIILLDPVLQKTGLSPAQSHKIYEMVLPFDRILDMSQTALNVMGDAMVALDVWRKEKLQGQKSGKKPDGQKPEGKKWGDRLRAKIDSFRRAQTPGKTPEQTPEKATAPEKKAAVNKKPAQDKKPAPPAGA